MTSEDPLRYLNEIEKNCLLRYLNLLIKKLKNNLREVWLFGSFARGDMWSSTFPINSDIDILVLLNTKISKEMHNELINKTYPIYLESGRQISPQFFTTKEFFYPTSSPKKHDSLNFKNTVLNEGKLIFPKS